MSTSRNSNVRWAVCLCVAACTGILVARVITSRTAGKPPPDVGSTATIDTPTVLSTESGAQSQERAPLGEPSYGGGNAQVVGATAESTRRAFLVHVIDRSAAPVAGARVCVAVVATTRALCSAQSDVSGTAMVEVPEDTEAIRCVSVSAIGYSTQEFWSPVAAVASREWTAIEVTLRRAASITVKISDAAGVPVAHHLVTLMHLESLEGLHGARSVACPNARVSWGLCSDRSGVCVADELDSGWWLVKCERWRGREPTEGVRVLAEEGSTTECSLSPRRMPADQFASGVIRIADGAAVLNCGLYEDYELLSDATSCEYEGVFEDGSFYVYGRSGDVCGVRVKQRSLDRTSIPYDVLVGTHNCDITPKWIK